jgi:hypothetical protein
MLRPIAWIAAMMDIYIERRKRGVWVISRINWGIFGMENWGLFPHQLRRVV